MNAPNKIDMLAALRLTREGRLDEAMAAIRRSLSPATPSDATSSFDLPTLPPLPGGAGLPRFSIAGALGGLVRRFARFRPAHEVEESREQGFKQEFREDAEEQADPANVATIGLMVQERVATPVDESLDLTVEEALQPAPLERVQPVAPVAVAPLPVPPLPVPPRRVRKPIAEKRAESPEKTPNRRPARKLEGAKLQGLKLEGLKLEAFNLERIFAPAVARAPVGAPGERRFEQRSFSNAAGSRAYKLYVPSGHADEPLPLLVMLHGCTQSPDDFAAGTRMNLIAEEQKFLVAYPAQPSSANMGKCWNWFNSGDQRRDNGEPSIIAGITREIMEKFPVEPERVYIAGLSAGGAAAANMGSLYPDLYAAIGVHSGLACGAASDMPSAFTAMKQGATATKSRLGGETVPAIVFHGDRDTTVHPANGDDVVVQAKGGANLQATVTSGVAAGGRKFTRTVHADAKGLPVAEHWILHGAGHAWSGGDASGSYTDPRGPDASREMMRFFARHRVK
jgi:poly(hydroxyalkanoate) depolymerase family esterase